MKKNLVLFKIVNVLMALLISVAKKKIVVDVAIKPVVNFHGKEPTLN